MRVSLNFTKIASADDFQIIQVMTGRPSWKATDVDHSLHGISGRHGYLQCSQEENHNIDVDIEKLKCILCI